MPGEWERKIIKAGYIKLAEKSHTDHGGKAEDMVALNAARDNLLSRIDVPQVPIPQPISPPWPTAVRPEWLNPEIEAQIREVITRVRLRQRDPDVSAGVDLVGQIFDFFTKPRKPRGPYKRRR